MATTFGVDLQFTAKTRELDATIRRLQALERETARVQGQLDKFAKLTANAFSRLGQNNQVRLDTRQAERQIARLREGIIGLNQRAAVRLEATVTRRDSGGSTASAEVVGRTEGATAAAAAVGAAAAATTKLKKAEEGLAPVLNANTAYSEDREAAVKELVAAQAKVDAQLEKQAAAERRLQQNEAGFADANKTKAASLRDARNAYQATTNWLNKYQAELAQATANVQYLTIAEQSLARIQERRTAVQQRAAQQRQALYAPTPEPFGGFKPKSQGGIGAGVVAGASLTNFPGQQAVQAFGLGNLVGGAKGGIAAIVTQATLALAQASGPATEYAASLAKLQVALKNVAVNQEAYTTALNAIKSASSDFNVPIKEAAAGFLRLQAAAQANGYTAGEVAKVYRGLVAANTALAGSQEDLQGIIYATGQVFSKGKVTAEELRGQIGERLPGAFALFAQATGRSTQALDKALEDGEVKLSDFVKFTDLLLKKYEANAKLIADAPANAGERLKKKLTDLQGAIGQLLAPIGAAFQDFASKAANEIQFVINKLNDLFGLSEKSKNDRLYNLEQNLIKRLQSDIDRMTADGVNDQAIKPYRLLLKQYQAEAKRLRAERGVNGGSLPPKADPNAPSAEELDRLEKERLKALEKERGIQSELRQLAIQQAEVEAASGRIGKDRLSQLNAQMDAMTQLVKMQLNDIKLGQDDPRVKAAKRGLALAEYSREGNQLQEEINQLLKDIDQLGVQGANLRRELLGGQIQVTETPLQTAIRETKEQLQDADQAALELLNRLNDWAGTNPQGEGVRNLLGNLRGDIAATDPNRLASQKLTQGDAQSMEEQQRSLQAQIAALKAGRTELTGMEELINRYGADWANLDPTVKGHLVDLVRTNDALQEQLQKLQQIRADAEALSGITVTGIQDAIVASVTNGDVRAAFSSMFEQLGNQFLSMAFRPIQQWLTNEIAKLLGLSLADATQTAAITANTGAVSAAATAISTTVIPTVTANTTAVTALTSAVVANTAAQSAGSATSAVSGFNLGSLFGGGGDGLGNLFGGATSGIDWGQTPSIVGTPFASGGFVTGPTQAVIGEGGTSEYVIPANKMPSAMARWNAGARGEAVVNGADPTGGSEGGGALGGAPTQISISGGILQFNDSNYIRQDQVPAIVNQASQAGEQRALRKLQMSPATRRRVGV